MHMLTVVAQNRVMSSTAAFADSFLPVMPPFVHRYSRAAFA